MYFEGNVFSKLGAFVNIILNSLLPLTPLFTCIKNSLNKKPRGDIAPLTFGHNSNQQVATFGIKTMLCNPIQSMQSQCTVSIYLFKLITSHHQILNKDIPT